MWCPGLRDALGIWDSTLPRPCRIGSLLGGVTRSWRDCRQQALPMTGWHPLNTVYINSIENSPDLGWDTTFARGPTSHRPGCLGTKALSPLCQDSCRQIIEVILGVSLKTLSNYVNHISQTPVDDGFAKRSWQPVNGATRVV